MQRKGILRIGFATRMATGGEYERIQEAGCPALLMSRSKTSKHIGTSKAHDSDVIPGQDRIGILLG